MSHQDQVDVSILVHVRVKRKEGQLRSTKSVRKSVLDNVTEYVEEACTGSWDGLSYSLLGIQVLETNAFVTCSPGVEWGNWDLLGGKSDEQLRQEDLDWQAHEEKDRS